MTPQAVALKWSTRFLELALSFSDPAARALAFHLSSMHTALWATLRTASHCTVPTQPR